MFDFLSHGLAGVLASDIAQGFALALPRIAVGLFFALSGWHKLFNAERHAKLTRTLMEDKVPAVGFMQWWVPFWELTSGALLVVGLFSALNAAILVVVCVVACLCEAPAKVARYNPIDAGDKVDDYLYLPEVLYLLMLLVTILGGPGRYSLDSFFFR